MIKKIIKHLMLILIFSSFVLGTEIKIIVPISSPNAHRVPVKVKIAPSLEEGDTLSLFSNKNLVATISTDNKFKYYEFKTYMKLPKTGYFSVKIERKNGEKSEKKKLIKILNPKEVTDYVAKGKGRAEIKGKNLKVFFPGYSREVLVETDSGSLLVKTTKYISSNIFISIKSNDDYKNTIVKVPSKNMVFQAYEHNYQPSSALALIGIVAGIKWIYGGTNSESSSSSSPSNSKTTLNCKYSCISDVGIFYETYYNYGTINVTGSSYSSAWNKASDMAEKSCKVATDKNGYKMRGGSVNCD